MSDARPTPSSPLPRIVLSSADAEAPWADDLTRRAEDACARASDRLGLAPPTRIRIVTQPNAWAFERYLGARPTHVIAVARPDRNEIVIDLGAWRRASPVQQRQTLVHEMTHLILHRHVQGRLPAWLDEGLAMVVAEQRNEGATWRVMAAGSFGHLIPLSRLQWTTLMGGETQALAYAESLAVTRYLLRRSYGHLGRDPEDPAPLMRELADPELGPGRVRRLWEPAFRDALERQWHRDSHTVWTLVGVFSGASVLWGAMTALFLLAWWRKRRMAQLKRERFDEEDERDEALGWADPAWAFEHDEDAPDDE